MPELGSPAAELWDWRSRTADLYAHIRAEPDPQAGWLHWRAVRDTMFRSHPQTPLDHPERFDGLPVHDYDPALRHLVALQPTNEPAITLTAGADGEVLLHPFARTQGLQGPLGAELTLFWIQGYGGGVFLPFADATSGVSTYGGGRYLLDTIKGADLGTTPQGHAILDFNFAYNPSCAYTPRYTCPLTPHQNRLPAPIQAGERTQPTSDS